MFRRWLTHPLMRDRDIDLSETTQLRRQLLSGKPFLKALYREWYGRLAATVPTGEGLVLEIGSGAGFMRDVIPEVITSDVLPLEGVDQVIDALHLPFADGALRAMLLVDVLHHLPKPVEFLAEASRAVRPGGVLSMIEPWNTLWSRLVYRRLHHEPFEPDAGWEATGRGPLSRANGALPWILFERDRGRLMNVVPKWRIARRTPLMPIAYLLSGGVSFRSLAPGRAYPWVRRVERLFELAGTQSAMFAHILLERVEAGVPA